MKKLVILLLSLLIGILFLNSCSTSKNSEQENFLFLRKKLTLIDKMGPAFMQQLGVGIYNAVIKGEIAAYSNDSLSKFALLTKEKALEKGRTEEMIQYIPDPEYPDFYIDSLIITPFKTDRIKAYEISAKIFQPNQNALSNLKLNAFAICYEPIIGGIKLREQALFYIKYEDLQKLIKKDDFEMLGNLIIQSIVKQSSDY